MDKGRNLDFSGTNIFIGLDTHLKSWRTTVMVEDTVYKTFSQDPNALVLKRFLDNNFPKANYFSAYEASFSGFKTHRDLLALGIDNIVVNPADVPTTNKERVQKEDSRDSRKLARQLSNGDLTAIHVPSLELEGDRNLLRYRKTLTKEIARSKNRIKSQLYFFGITIPEHFSGKKYWSKRFTNWLQQVELPTESARFVLTEQIETTESLRKKQHLITKQIRKLSEKQAYKENYKLLRSVPGIGCLTAMIILTEIGDISRFKTLDQLCSYIGLVPMTRSSGEKDNAGNITKRKHSILRTAIIESAWVAIRNDPALMLAYQELHKQMKPQKAIVRIAKKLTNRIRYVLKNKKTYECAIVK